MLQTTMRRKTLTLWMTDAEFVAYQATSEDAQVRQAARLLGIDVSQLRVRLDHADADLRVRRATGLFFTRLTPTAEA